MDLLQADHKTTPSCTQQAVFDAMTASVQEAKGPDSSEKKTLFVKNLPENATKEQLELVFSEVGRLRHCFVVKKRKTDEFRGIGFVTFTDPDSVDAALKRQFKLGDNQLDVTLAEDKKKKGKM